MKESHAAPNRREIILMTGAASVMWTGVMLIAMGALALSSCATTPGARPDDMSEAEHRKEAVKHLHESERAAERYDPDRLSHRRIGAVRAKHSHDDLLYNPTARHKALSEGHLRHAEDHLSAAEALAAFEDQACEDVRPDTRAKCPLLGTIASATHIPGGVRLQLEEGADVEGVASLLRCHLAYAKARVRKGMDRCPVYLQGVQIHRAADGGIDLTAGDDAVVDELRHRTQLHVVP